MRTREIKKSFYINYDEQEELKRKSISVGLTESELLRCLIRGFVPKEKPGKEFYDEIKNLRMIGNNLNQLTKYANTTGKLREIEIIKIKDLIERFIFELKEKYLSREKVDILNSKSS